jgi:hypothetical protein
MPNLNPFAIPGRFMHESNMRAIALLRSIGAGQRQGFWSSDIPNIQFVDLTKDGNTPINFDDFAGRLALGNGLLASHQSPFNADGVNITLVRWGKEPDQCGRITAHESVTLSECHIVSYAEVRIEKDVLFGPGAVIMDCDGSPVDPTKPWGVDNLRMAPVVIEHRAWIGNNVIIMPGVTIGHHATISTGAVVTTDVPPHCVAVGNPANVAVRFVK